MLEINQVHLGDCLELMKEIPDQSVDCIITDPPYGTTACSWDIVVPFSSLWAEFKRIAKPNAPIIMFGTQPFTTLMISSNIRYFRHSYVWDKKFAGNFVQAKRMPMKVTEDIVVFSFGAKNPNYYPQMIVREKPIKSGGNKQTKAIPIARTENSEEFGKVTKVYTEKFPTNLLEYSNRSDRGLHPTQKSVELLEHLIKTYSLSGQTILDCFSGSGSTLLAARNLGRNFLGIEMNPEFHKMSKQRLGL